MYLFDDDYNVKPVTPAKPEAEALANAVVRLMQAHLKLEKETEKESGKYNPVHSTAEMVGQEQEEFNRAADALYDLVYGGAHDGAARG